MTIMIDLCPYMIYFSFRVLDLEKKKEDAKNQKDSENTATMDCDKASSDDEDEFDEYLDWRAKKSYR